MIPFNVQSLSAAETYGYDEATLAATHRANRRIDTYWWHRWQKNLEANNQNIRRLPRLSARFGRRRGRPCLVAAAGPSLQREIKHVKQAVENGWYLIAVDRAFPMLKAAGVKPNITITNDASPNVTQFFREDMVQPDDHFALCVISHPDVFETLSACKRSVYACINPFSAFWKYVSGKYDGDTACLRPGYVVTFPAVDLALWLGCDPVVTIGNDLSWERLADVDPPYHQSRLVILSSGRITIQSFYRAASAFRFFTMHHPERTFIDASDGIMRGWPGAALGELVSREYAAGNTSRRCPHEVD